MDLYIHSPIRLHGVMLNYLSTGTTLPYLYLTHAGSLASTESPRVTSNYRASEQ
jgi:hypothetical protein